MPRLKDKVIFITGAASGIGLATAQRFIEEGATVVLADIDADALDAAVADLDESRACPVTMDIKNQAQVEQAVAFVQEKYGRLDIAVLNAGVTGANMSLEDYPVALFDEVMAVNLRGTWLCLRAVIPMMKKQQQGSIVLTSSIQGLSALAGTTAYTTSKHALVGMMKGAALELAQTGVRVNTVHPGYVATPMMDAIHHAVAPDAPEQFRTALSGSVPMGRYANADEIASLILFLASDESGYCTGSCFQADGGIVAALPTADTSVL